MAHDERIDAWEAHAHGVRSDALKRMRHVLRSCAVDDVDAFVDVLRAVLVLDVDAITIAKRAGLSTSTITRWSQRFHSPDVERMRIGSEAMIHVLDEEIRRIARILRRSPDHRKAA